MASPKVRKPHPVSDANLSEYAEAFRKAKANAAVWEGERKEAQAALIDAMAAAHKTEARYSPEPGVVTTVTIVQSSTLEYDEAALEQAMGPALWEKVTTRKLDLSLLESAVALGLINPEDIAPHTSEKPRAPYARLKDTRGAQ